jgi:hypothetical protein
MAAIRAVFSPMPGHVSEAGEHGEQQQPDEAEQTHADGAHSFHSSMPMP